ncbi:hypothetical protein ACFYNO_33180 [Kitasatospora sp. NPDC006697]|uniref:hypothetical protein n=1 Tax=Kitasatospora sp. NPDC006697 TaxID=3364020 RepID=UPI0036C510E1
MKMIINRPVPSTGAPVTDPAPQLFTRHDDPPSPTTARPEPDLQEPDDGLTASERDALAQASVTGQHAAHWIRSLAARQPEPGNRTVLEQYASAVEQVMRREVIPGSEGLLEHELDYALDAYVLLGSATARRRPDLTAAERLALLAVGFTARTAPRTVLNDLTDLAGCRDSSSASAATRKNMASMSAGRTSANRLATPIPA